MQRRFDNLGTHNSEIQEDARVVAQSTPDVVKMFAWHCLYQIFKRLALSDINKKFDYLCRIVLIQCAQKYLRSCHHLAASSSKQTLFNMAKHYAVVTVVFHKLACLLLLCKLLLLSAAAPSLLHVQKNK